MAGAAALGLAALVLVGGCSGVGEGRSDTADAPASTTVVATSEPTTTIAPVSTTAAPLPSTPCDNGTWAAIRPSGAVVIEAVGSAAGQAACARVSAASQRIGDGTVEECAELVVRATATGDLAALLPDEELRASLSRAAAIEQDAGERCVAAGDPDLLIDSLDGLSSAQAFYERLTELGIEVRPRGR